MEGEETAAARSRRVSAFEPLVSRLGRAGR